MNPDELIDRIADRADELLAGASNRAQARAGVEEQVTLEQPGLPPAERHRVVEGVMAILDREGFFEGEHAAGSTDDEANDD